MSTLFVPYVCIGPAQQGTLFVPYVYIGPTQWWYTVCSLCICIGATQWGTLFVPYVHCIYRGYTVVVHKCIHYYYLVRCSKFHSMQLLLFNT